MIKKNLQCKNKKNQTTVFNKIEKPTSFFARNNGLMFRDTIENDCGFMITGCNGIGWIHTFFMKFSIDIIYLNKNMQIKQIKRNVKPNRLTWPILGTWNVIECSANNLKLNDLVTGDTLYVEA